MAAQLLPQVGGPAVGCNEVLASSEGVDKGCAEGLELSSGQEPASAGAGGGTGVCSNGAGVWVALGSAVWYRVQRSLRLGGGV